MTLLLFALAIIPSALLLIYIKKKNNYTSQPTSLIIKLVVLGMFACLPAYVFETVLDYAFLSILDNLAVYNFLSSFVTYGFIEEILKFLVLFYLTDKYNQYYRTVYDGIIYSVCVALGFAVLEDILYIFIYYGGDLTVALLRAVTPGHFCFSIFMGMFLSEAKKYENFDEYKHNKYRILSVLVPVLIHGMYDYCIIVGGYFIFIFGALLISLYIVVFKVIKRNAENIYFI